MTINSYPVPYFLLLLLIIIIFILHILIVALLSLYSIQNVNVCVFVWEQVAYAQGEMKMQDIPDLITLNDDSPIRTCLMTKWPTVELNWLSGVTPSLN